MPFETGLDGLEVRSDKEVDTTTTLDAAGHPAAQARRGPPGRDRQRRRARRSTSTRACPRRHRRDHGLPARPPATRAELDGQWHRPRRRGSDRDPDRARSAGTYDLFDLYDGKLAAKPTLADLAGKDDESGLEPGLRHPRPGQGRASASRASSTSRGRPTRASPSDRSTYDNVRARRGRGRRLRGDAVRGRRPLPGPGARRRRRAAQPDPGGLRPLRARRRRRGLPAEPAGDAVGRENKKPQLELAPPRDRPGRRGDRHDPQAASAAGAGEGVAARRPRRARRAAQRRPLRGLAAREVHPGGHHLDDDAEPRPGASTTTTVKKAPEPCPDGDDAGRGEGRPGAPGQTTAENRKGKRGAPRSRSRPRPGDHRLAARLLAAVPRRPRPDHGHPDRRGRGVVLPPRPRHAGRAGGLQADLRADHGRTDPDHAVRRRLDLGRGPARDGLRLLPPDAGRAVGRPR